MRPCLAKQGVRLYFGVVSEAPTSPTFAYAMKLTRTAIDQPVRVLLTLSAMVSGKNHITLPP